MSLNVFTFPDWRLKGAPPFSFLPSIFFGTDMTEMSMMMMMMMMMMTSN